ncbi:MAG: hypothetical protein HC872_07175 [Gammaproteobacteria bacterium]|nr:hypothetical protein [Gammaproteobacteria bacterium]
MPLTVILAAVVPAAMHFLAVFTIVHLEAKINVGTKPGIADFLEIKMLHGPIARTFFPATDAWLQEQNAKAANRDVERAKQQGVKPAL